MPALPESAIPVLSWCAHARGPDSTSSPFPAPVRSWPRSRSRHCPPTGFASRVFCRRVRRAGAEADFARGEIVLVVAGAAPAHGGAAGGEDGHGGALDRVLKPLLKELP